MVVYGDWTTGYTNFSVHIIVGVNFLLSNPSFLVSLHASNALITGDSFCGEQSVGILNLTTPFHLVL